VQYISSCLFICILISQTTSYIWSTYDTELRYTTANLILVPVEFTTPLRYMNVQLNVRNPLLMANVGNEMEIA
jgi:hypothetical protein